MIAIAWVLSIALSLFIGNEWHKIRAKIKSIEEQLKVKLDKKVDEKKAEIIDPYDIVYQTRIEHDRVMKELNR